MSGKRALRNSNIEWLRVIAMIMVVTLHYFNNGGILDAAVYRDTNFASAWFIESLCYGAVNIYVLISGWMLSASTSSVKPGKVLRLILQAVFYSAGIYLVCCFTGVVSFNVKSLITGYLFPIVHGEYWLATVYIVLYLLHPFINKGLAALSQQEHRRLLIELGVVFSGVPTVFFFSGNAVGVNQGYSLVWFVFLYALANYLRKYPVQLPQKWLLSSYVISCLLVFGIKWGQQAILGAELWNWYSYTSVPVLVGSVALFLFFIQLPPQQNRMAVLLGGTTFGVFLIHTQYILRDTLLWKQWVKPLEHYYTQPWMFLPHLLLSVLLIFVACSGIDWLREQLFSLVATRCRPWAATLKSRFDNKVKLP